MNLAYFYFVLFLGLSIIWGGYSSGTFSGRVTDGNRPIQGAIVRIQATTISDTTDADGFFILPNVGLVSGKMITAWKKGYYNAGVKIPRRSTDIEIVLSPLSAKDNPTYQWIDPALNLEDSVKNCGDCHASIIYQQWSQNGHARVATSPRFLDLYNGTDAEAHTGVPPGFRLDYPRTFGNCATCHAPAAAIDKYIGVDMNKLGGMEKLGVFCDFCHKVKNVHLKDNSGLYTGVMLMEMLRPPEGHQMFFRPFDDDPEPDAFSPIISKSIFCTPCHLGSFWGVPIYESYTEWLASPYAHKGIQCQDCHMKPNGFTTDFAPGKGGIERDPATIPTHTQPGSPDSTFLASAVEMHTRVRQRGDTLRVVVSIKNVGAGHHIPTDQPMRNLILLVEAVDSIGNDLKYIGQTRVPWWGGRGNPAEGNYAGLPDKGFAKILFGTSPLYAEPFIVRPTWKNINPAPQWRFVNIIEDSRIPAMATDVSAYDFLISHDDLPVTITTRLIYRRTFKNWAKMKDILLARDHMVIQLYDQKYGLRILPTTIFTYPQPVRIEADEPFLKARFCLTIFNSSGNFFLPMAEIPIHEYRREVPLWIPKI